jgi:hypothetical protein
MGRRVVPVENLRLALPVVPFCETVYGEGVVQSQRAAGQTLSIGRENVLGTNKREVSFRYCS